LEALKVQKRVLWRKMATDLGLLEGEGVRGPAMPMHSRSYKVIDFVSSQKRVCDFLLVRDRNLHPNLHCFGYIAGFCAPD